MVILLEIYIAFIQRLLIYINDPILEINSDRLTFRCNDTLDEALAIAEGILTNHDNITLLGVVVYGAAGQKKNVTIYQRLVHGVAFYYDHSKQQNIQQHKDHKNIDNIEVTEQRLFPVFRRIQWFFFFLKFGEKGHKESPCFLETYQKGIRFLIALYTHWKEKKSIIFLRDKKYAATCGCGI
jgi:hypothetical protein